MAILRIAQIIQESFVDGPGRRVVVLMHGCPIHCPDCQNKHLWDLDGGQEMDTDDLAAMILDSKLPLSLTGGEPFAQAEAVAELLVAIDIQDPDRHVIVYSGFTLEDLLTMAEAIPEIIVVLRKADILVDGPFIAALDTPWMQWMGSSNQRAIDLHSTLLYADEGRRCWFENIIELDWDTQVLTVTGEGDVIGTAGSMTDLFGDDGLERTRMCGETTKADEQTAYARGVTDQVLGRSSNPFRRTALRREWEHAHRIAAIFD